MNSEPLNLACGISVHVEIANSRYYIEFRDKFLVRENKHLKRSEIAFRWIF